MVPDRPLSEALVVGGGRGFQLSAHDAHTARTAHTTKKRSRTFAAVALVGGEVQHGQVAQAAEGPRDRAVEQVLQWLRCCVVVCGSVCGGGG